MTHRLLKGHGHLQDDVPGTPTGPEPGQNELDQIDYHFL